MADRISQKRMNKTRSSLSISLVREFSIHLIPYTFPGIFAPFDTRRDVIPDYKPAGAAAYLDII